LYQSKAAGKARHSVFNSYLKKLVMERLDLSTDLLLALALRELQPDYPHIHKLSDGKFAVIKALLHWYHPGFRLFAPLTFLFVAAVSSWMILEVANLAGLVVNFHRIVEVLFGAAIMAGLYGVFNAGWTRVTRTTVRLANLPASWHGRRAALISDVHLGHVRNGTFLRRMVAKILSEEPDAIFIAGDLYDGTAIDAGRAAEPLSELTAPHGVYFVAGNHEQFGDDSKYLRAVEAAGVRVLSNEKVEADGLQIIGVPYRHATHGGHFHALHHVHLRPLIGPGKFIIDAPRF